MSITNRCALTSASRTTATVSRSDSARLERLIIRLGIRPLRVNNSLIESGDDDAEPEMKDVGE